MVIFGSKNGLKSRISILLTSLYSKKFSDKSKNAEFNSVQRGNCVLKLDYDCDSYRLNSLLFSLL